MAKIIVKKNGKKVGAFVRKKRKKIKAKKRKIKKLPNIKKIA